MKLPSGYMDKVHMNQMISMFALKFHLGDGTSRRKMTDEPDGAK
jgi:hypothetical protein